MDISSTAHSQKSPTPHTKEPQEQEVSSPEQIRSVEPEIESLGAEGGECTSYVPDVQRSAIAVLPTTTLLSAPSLQESENKLFYGIYPVLPFTQEHLEEVNTRIRILAGHLRNLRASNVKETR